MKAFQLAGVLALVAAVSLGTEPSHVFAEEGATLAALQIAYTRELDARRSYLAFAVRADAEGHPGVAGLFRATAEAERIHAANHAFAIEWMDAKAVWVPESVAVRGTAANLEASIDGELHERGLVYRKFMDLARAENEYDVLASFGYARHAEETHAMLFLWALLDLPKDRALEGDHADPRPRGATAGTPAGNPVGDPGDVPGEPAIHAPTFFVCPDCGAVSAGPMPRRCECGASGSNHLAIE